MVTGDERDARMRPPRSRHTVCVDAPTADDPQSLCMVTFAEASKVYLDGANPQSAYP